jgi:hypothetical protein
VDEAKKPLEEDFDHTIFCRFNQLLVWRERFEAMPH